VTAPVTSPRRTQPAQQRGGAGSGRRVVRPVAPSCCPHEPWTRTAPPVRHGGRRSLSAGDEGEAEGQGATRAHRHAGPRDAAHGQRGRARRDVAAHPAPRRPPQHARPAAHPRALRHRDRALHVRRVPHRRQHRRRHADRVVLQHRPERAHRWRRASAGSRLDASLHVPQQPRLRAGRRRRAAGEPHAARRHPRRRLDRRERGRPARDPHRARRGDRCRRRRDEGRAAVRDRARSAGAHRAPPLHSRADRAAAGDRLAVLERRADPRGRGRVQRRRRFHRAVRAGGPRNPPTAARRGLAPPAPARRAGARTPLSAGRRR